MANVGGVPVWSRSGKGAESLAGFGIHNTHNPAVQQRGSVLLATYVVPQALRATLTSLAFCDNVYLMWPQTFFVQTARVLTGCTFEQSNQLMLSKIEETLQRRREKERQGLANRLNAALQTFSYGVSGTQSSTPSPATMNEEEKLQVLMENGVGIWQIGYRQECFIAVSVTGKWYINDEKETKDAFFLPDPYSTPITLRRYWTEYKKTNILVVMGHRNDYRDIPDFVDRHLSKFVFDVTPTSFKVTFPDNETLSQRTMSYEYPVN
jgi:hypothetical protein